jgi:GNAT superfamily N-acetyltransferase
MQSTQAVNPETIFELQRGEFLISTDRARLDREAIHGFLTNSYWAKGISRETVARSIEHSMCFGVYDGNCAQVGFARVVSDFATYAYIADVFVLESHRGCGVAKSLMECIVQHPALQGLRRWNLTTRDAHTLYARFGFVTPKWPERYMEILRPNIYQTPASETTVPERSGNTT